MIKYDYTFGSVGEIDIKHKIAILSDVHGNVSALQAVVNDAANEKVTDYWFLGDLIMPGPGANNLFSILNQINVSAYVKGNWEDCFIDVLNKEVDVDHATDIYIARLVKYQCENLDEKHIKFIKNRPLHETKNIGNLSISLSHHLPTKNYGRDLSPTSNQDDFDRLFVQDYDIAIYAHTHQPILRYGSNGQLIINPGSIGQPFSSRVKFKTDRRAQYAILEIDDQGVNDIRFKKVSYDIQEEIYDANQSKLPYVDLYQEMLETGVTHTHNLPLLQKINDKYQFREEVIAYFNLDKT